MSQKENEPINLQKQSLKRPKRRQHPKAILCFQQRCHQSTQLPFDNTTHVFKNLDISLTKPQFDAVNSAFERIFGLTNLCHLSAIIIKTSHYYVTHVHSDPLFLPPPTPVDIHHPGRAAMPWEGGGRLTLQMDPAGSSQRAVRRKWDTFQLSLHSPS